MPVRLSAASRSRSKAMQARRVHSRPCCGRSRAGVISRRSWRFGKNIDASAQRAAWPPDRRFSILLPPMTRMRPIVFLAFAPLASAQNPPAQPADPRQLPIFGPGQTIELTIERALEIAEQSNLGLKIETLTTEIAMRDYRGSWGAFDWQVAARAGVTDAEFQSRDVFGGTSENSREFSLD